MTLRRGVRYSNGAQVRPGRRALHVRAAVQGPRADGRVALRRDRGRRPVPAEPRDLHARPRRRAERPHDHVPSHAARRRLAAEARAAARRAAAAEHGYRGDRHGRLAPRRHRPVLLGVLRAGAAARPAPQPVLQGLGAGRPAGRLRRSHRAALRAGRRGRGHRGRARPGRLGRRRHPSRPAARAAAPLRAAAARQPVARRLVRRAQLQHQAVRRARGAAGRQSRDRQERDRQALRRAAARGADLPGDPARLPGVHALLPVDARRHRALVGPGSRARAAARRGVGHRRRPRRHRRRRRRRAEGHRRVHSGRAVQARIRPAREGSPGRRPVRVRAELAQPRGGGARTVEAGVSGAVRAARRPARLRLLRAGLRREPQHQRLLRPPDGRAADAARARARPHAPARPPSGCGGRSTGASPTSPCGCRSSTRSASTSSPSAWATTAGARSCTSCSRGCGCDR